MQFSVEALQFEPGSCVFHQAQVVEVMAEIPQLQLLKKSVAIPEGLMVLFTQTSGSLGTAL